MAVPTLVTAPNPPKLLSLKRPPPKERPLPPPKLAKLDATVPQQSNHVEPTDAEVIESLKLENDKLTRTLNKCRTNKSRLKKRLTAPSKVEHQKAKVKAAVESVSELLTGGVK